MKANVVKPNVPFEFEGKTYNLSVTFLTEAKIIAEWGGSVTEALKGPKGLLNMIKILTWLINDDIDERNEKGENLKSLTEGYVGRHLRVEDSQEIIGKIAEVFGLSRPDAGDEELTDDEIKN